MDGLTEDMLDNYKILKEKYPLEDDWIRFGFLKGHIDGTLGSGTALFFEPFEDEPDKSGLPFQSYEELERIIVAADKMGFQIAIHAIGSLGNNLSLNAIEKAQELNGVRDSRPTALPINVLRKKESDSSDAEEPMPGNVSLTQAPRLLLEQTMQ